MIVGEEVRGGWVVSVGVFSFLCGGGVGGGLSGVMVGLWWWCRVVEVGEGIWSKEGSGGGEVGS